jgi:hypothetical protein
VHKKGKRSWSFLKNSPTNRTIDKRNIAHTYTRSDMLLITPKYAPLVRTPKMRFTKYSRSPVKTANMKNDPAITSKIPPLFTSSVVTVTKSLSLPKPELEIWVNGSSARNGSAGVRSHEMLTAMQRFTREMSMENICWL